MDIQKTSPKGSDAKDPADFRPEGQNASREDRDASQKRKEGKISNSHVGAGKIAGLVFFVEVIKVVVMALIIIVPIRTFVFQPFFVQGASMEPNFHNGEYLIINELGYKKTVVAAGDKELFTVDQFKDLGRGDAVVFRYPKNPKQFFIKRIVGLPGERVSIKNGLVKIFNEENPQGFILEEREYLPTFVETEGEVEKRLANDEYFVLGDNRSHSSDSRVWGALPSDMIIGKVLLRAWPFQEFKIF